VDRPARRGPDYDRRVVHIARIALPIGLTAILSLTSVAVRTDAQQNRGRRTYGPGQCGPADQTYLHIANETGGQPYFLSPLELPRSAQVMRETAGDAALIVWASAVAAERDVPIPIDSTIRRVTIAATFDTKGGTLKLVAPNGAVDANVTEDNVLNCGRVATIESPPTGLWHARLTATGRFWLTGHARTELDIVTSEFVRPGGRPGHEGLFRIAGQPIAGEPSNVRIVLTDEEVKSTQFSFVSEQGTTLGALDLGDAGDHEFSGGVQLPTEPFRVAVTGLDATGAAYQRLHAGLFHAESVEVTIPGDYDSLKAGTSSEITSTIRNAGAPATFKIIAADGHRYVKNVEPQEVTLGTGESITVKIRIAVPAAATAVDAIDVTVTASSQGPRATMNGTTRHFTIAK
jgi:von Willebrand factor A domain-containing protein 7